MTIQEENYLLGAEMLLLLENTTPEHFEQYRAEFMEQATSRPTVKAMLEAVFDLAEKRRKQKGGSNIR